MNTARSGAGLNHRRKQQGASLLIGLVFLLVITMLALANLREVTLESRITGNLIENKRLLNVADAATREIMLTVGGQEMQFDGQTFLSVYSLPQFYFHMTTAYNILRHNGVVIGKRDYMAA